MKRLAWVLFAVGCEAEDPAIWEDEVLAADADGLSRVKGALYYLDMVQDERVEAHAYDFRVPEDDDDGTMVYATTIDQAMIDQLNDVSAVGGVNELVFTLRSGLSFRGGGNGFFSGDVQATAGGDTIGSVNEAGSTNGTIQTTYRLPIDSGQIVQMQPGESFEVTGTGHAEASSGGEAWIDQAIVSWYITAGRPYIRSVP
jgi:hypothetical protein